MQVGGWCRVPEEATVSALHSALFRTLVTAHHHQHHAACSDYFINESRRLRLHISTEPETCMKLELI